MSVLIWSDTMKLDHPRLDEDHRKLVDLVGRIEDGIGSRDPETVGAVLADLDSACREHFEYEEGLMAEIPVSIYGAHIDRHKQRHRDFEREVTEMRACVAEHRDARQAAQLSCLQKESLGNLLQDLLELDGELVGYLITEGKHTPVMD